MCREFEILELKMKMTVHELMIILNRMETEAASSENYLKAVERRLMLEDLMSEIYDYERREHE